MKHFATYQVNGKPERLSAREAKIIGFPLGERLAAIHQERILRQSRKNLTIIDRCRIRLARELGIF